MLTLMYPGKQIAILCGFQQGPTATRLNFTDSAGRCGFQVLKNEHLRAGLRQLGETVELNDLLHRSCVVRVERVQAEHGLEAARVTDCQWLPEDDLRSPGPALKA